MQHKGQKKKILYVITKSNFGGAQRYVFELAVAMKGRGHTVAVAVGGSGVLKDKLAAEEIDVHTIRSLQRDPSLWKEMRTSFEFFQLIQHLKPDVVHLNSSKAGGLGAFVARLCGVRHIIFTAHGWPFLEPRNIVWKGVVWFLSLLTVLLSHTTILVSKYDGTHSGMSILNKKFKLIHTALPLISFLPRIEARAKLFSAEEQKLHIDDLWLVTNAELNHNKNLFTAIDAVSTYNTLSQRKIFYTIIGDGEQREALEEYIEKQGVGPHVKFLGYVDDARNYFKAFDIFLLPSKKEGMPYALLEAGAAELPSIASNVGGIPEIIEDQKNGLLIDPNDNTTIVSALKTIIENPKASAHMAETLRQRVRENFALDKMVAQTEVLYLVT